MNIIPLKKPLPFPVFTVLEAGSGMMFNSTAVKTLNLTKRRWVKFHKTLLDYYISLHTKYQPITFRVGISKKLPHAQLNCGSLKRLISMPSGRYRITSSHDNVYKLVLIDEEEIIDYLILDGWQAEEMLERLKGKVI